MKEIQEFNNEGTVFGSIGKSDFMNFHITTPDDLSVDRFQKKVRPLDDKVICNELTIQKLTSLRDTLLPKLMSGDVRVHIDG